jgi:hypothetical protein
VWDGGFQANFDFSTTIGELTFVDLLLLFFIMQLD